MYEVPSCMKFMYVECQVKVIGERQSNVPCLKDMELGNPGSSSMFMSVNLDRSAGSPYMCLPVMLAEIDEKISSWSFLPF